MRIDDDSVGDVVLMTQLPSNAWFEGFAMRPNGHSLATRLDQPELYTFDAEDPDATLQLVHTFPDANGLINICPLQGCDDEYAVISGVVDLAQVRFENFIVWRVSLSADGSSPPRVSRMAEMPDAGFCIGVMAASERTLLVADSNQNCIWRLDAETGESSVLIADDSMRAAGEDEFFGLNRLRIVGGFVWFTNTSGGTLCRFPIEEDAEVGLRATGPVEVLAADIPHCDGLAITKDQLAVYTASYLGGHLWKVEIDPVTGRGETRIVMENLVSPTAVELVHPGGGDGDGKPRLMVVCCGEIEIGWINDDKRSWSEFRNINESVTVTVTTEEVVESG